MFELGWEGAAGFLLFWECGVRGGLRWWRGGFVAENGPCRWGFGKVLVARR